MTDDTERRGAFFGRRKGKKLRTQQAERFDTLLPQLSLDLTQPAPDELSELFPFRPEAVRLEIGFGGGEHLIAQAEANPRTAFIGAEPFLNGMAKALAAIEEHGLTNVRLYHGDATVLLDWLPFASLDRIDLLYPDPLPKKRHWKRRFIQASSVAELARVLNGSGEFRFASDWPDYVSWTLERVTQAPYFQWTAERADDWRKPWPDFVRTRYEEKALREGRVPCYLAFRRVSA